jgi:hypothetical protein
VVVRPAERQIGSIADAPLSAPGEQRAQRLAELFGTRRGPGRIGALYAIELGQTRPTVAPLASRLDLVILDAGAERSERLAARLLRENEGSSALIAVPAAEIAPLVTALSGDRGIAKVAEADYGAIYIVGVPAFGRPSVLRLSY